MARDRGRIDSPVNFHRYGAEVDTTIVSGTQEKVSINDKLHSVDKEWRVSKSSV